MVYNHKYPLIFNHSTTLRFSSSDLSDKGTGSMGTPNIMHCIVHGSVWRSNACSAKVLSAIELRSSQSILIICKGYRAHTMQTVPQWAYLNIDANLLSSGLCFYHISARYV